MVKPSSSSVGDVGSIPGQEAKTPHASVAKTQIRSNIVTNSSYSSIPSFLSNFIMKGYWILGCGFFQIFVFSIKYNCH